MPIYEYKCSECGNIYEKRQKFTDLPDTECPACQKPSVHRLTSAPALVFKGSGWYINDYAKAGKGGGSNGKKSGGSSDGSGSTSTSSSSSSSSSDSSSSSTTATSNS
jgi:putative FmdB family regulatory protein